MNASHAEPSNVTVGSVSFVRTASQGNKYKDIDGWCTLPPPSHGDEFAVRVTGSTEHEEGPSPNQTRERRYNQGQTQAGSPTTPVPRDDIPE